MFIKCCYIHQMFSINMVANASLFQGTFCAVVSQDPSSIDMVANASLFQEFIKSVDVPQDIRCDMQPDVDPKKYDYRIYPASSEYIMRFWRHRSASVDPNSIINPYAYMQGKYMIDCLNMALREHDLLNGAEIVSNTNDPFVDSKWITAQLLDAFDVDPSNKGDIGDMLSDYAEPGEDAIDILKMVRNEDEPYEYECDDKDIVNLIADMNQSGYDLLQVKRYVDALGDFERVLDIDASNIHALHGKGIVLADLGRHAEAIHIFDTISDANDDPHILCHKGYSLIELKEYHKADACFDAALALDPTYDLALHEKGYVMLRLKRYDDAIKCCNQLLEANPNYPKALVNKGIALLQTNRFAEAVECFDASLSGNDHNIDALDGKINALYALKKYDDVLSSANDLLSASHGSLKAYDYKGHVLIELGRLKEALECFDAISRSDYDAVVHAWSHKGELHMQLAEHRDAIVCFLRVLDLSLPHKRDMNNMASCIMKEIGSIDQVENGGGAVNDSNLYLKPKEKLMSYGEFLLYLYDNPVRAIRYFDTMPSHIRGNTETLCDKATALFQLEKYDDSIKCIDAALASDPRNTHALNIKGTSLLHKNKLAEAKSCFDGVLSQYPDNTTALLSKAHIFYKMHMYDDAAKYYDLVHVKGHAGKVALNGVGYVMLKTGRYNGALKHFSRAAKKYPRDESFVLGMGVTLLHLKLNVDALNCFKRLPETTANSRFVQSAKGKALFGLNRYDDAIKCYKHVLDLV